jgi:hypothetical protein
MRCVLNAQVLTSPAGFQRCGNNSSIWLGFYVGSRVMTSLR